MGFDFSQPMTTYETIAITISLLALFMPIIHFLIKKFFYPLKLQYIPNKNIITILFNESGPYVSLGFSLNCQNQNILLKNIRIIIIRKSDNAQLSLIWSSLESPSTQKMSSGGMIFFNEAVRAMKIGANTLPLFLVEFEDTNSERVNKLKEIHTKKLNFSNTVTPYETPYEDTIKKFTEQETYQKDYNNILEEFFWKSGDYDFTLISTYDNEKELKTNYTFNITTDEHNSMKENIYRSLICRINLIYNISSNWYTLRKEYKEKN